MSRGEKRAELEERFALEYVQDLNATAAYRRIRPNVKEASARVEASRLLTNPNVQARIARLRAEQLQRLQMSADRVLQELAVCGFSDIGDYLVGDGGRLELAPGADPTARRALSSVKHKTRHSTRSDGTRETTYEVEYKLWSKPETLKALGQHLGLFKTDDAPSGCEIILGEGDEVRLIVHRKAKA